MDKTSDILRAVTEAIYEEESVFFVTLDADVLDLPLKGLQRLVLGGNATPSINITKEGIAASLSIDKVPYDVKIPWSSVSAVEGMKKAFYCSRETRHEETKVALNDKKKKTGHLRVIK